MRLTDVELVFEHMTSPEVAAVIKKTNVIVIPMAQTAGHGPHMPICTDILHVEETARRAIKELEKEGIKVVLGPSIPFTHAPSHTQFPGYINLEPETQAMLIRDVVTSLRGQGFRRVFLMKVGDGSTAPILTAVYWLRSKYPDVSLHVVDWFGLVLNVPCKSAPKGVNDGHSGEREVSSILTIAPELVHRNLFENFPSPFHRMEKENPLTGGVGGYRQALGIWSIKDYAPKGYHGDPTLATPELGEELLDKAGSILAQIIKTATKQV